MASVGKFAFALCLAATLGLVVSPGAAADLSLEDGEPIVVEQETAAGTVTVVTPVETATESHCHTNPPPAGCYVYPLFGVGSEGSVTYESDGCTDLEEDAGTCELVGDLTPEEQTVER
jgi:hypothetical protein